jgi:hypothetical protein
VVRASGLTTTVCAKRSAVVVMERGTKTCERSELDSVLSFEGLTFRRRASVSELLLVLPASPHPKTIGLHAPRMDRRSRVDTVDQQLVSRYSTFTRAHRSSLTTVEVDLCQGSITPSTSSPLEPECGG